MKLQSVIFRYFNEEADRVHLLMNRITDKNNTAQGWMTKGSETGWWELDLDLDPRLRACYGFIPLRYDEQLPTGPPPENDFFTRTDPLNPQPPLRTDGTGGGLSIYAGPEAPEQTDWLHAPAASPGTVVTVHRALASPARTTSSDGVDRIRPLSVYVPAGYHDEPLPVLVIFDGDQWFGQLKLAQALDAAIEDATLPPMVVLGIGNTSRADRKNILGVRDDVLESLVHDTLPWFCNWLTERHITVMPPGQWIIAGQSLGGIAALAAVTSYPEVFGYASVSSPSVWWHPGPGASPRALLESPPGAFPARWIHEYLLKQPVSGVLINVSIGSAEQALAHHAREVLHDMTAHGFDITTNIYIGGHDYACWRGELLQDLRAFTAAEQSQEL